MYGLYVLIKGAVGVVFISLLVLASGKKRAVDLTAQWTGGKRLDAIKQFITVCVYLIYEYYILLYVMPYVEEQACC